ncbi:MAG: hypothetical protein AAFX76_09275, partial [Planctomycetota bacterium]
LAHVEAKGVAAIAAEFGVEVRYVRQRIQLAALADVVKAAYRGGDIDTATAEVFASVPSAAQAEAWESCGRRVTNHHHAQQLIASDWIDAKHALFDVDALSGGNSGGSGGVSGGVSRDLFSERVMVERKAFFAAQAQAVEAEQERLLESGWVGAEVIAHNNLPDGYYKMDAAPVAFDEATTAAIAKLHKERDAVSRQIDDCEDEEAIDALWDEHDRLDTALDTLESQAEGIYTEAVKAVGTMFIKVGGDGGVTFEPKVPRATRSLVGGIPEGSTTTAPPVPEVDTRTLSDKQIRGALAHEVVAVRKAAAGDDARAKRTRRVLLALSLHQGITSSAALLVRRDTDPVAGYFAQDPGTEPDVAAVFTPWAWLQARHAAADPLHDQRFITDVDAYHAINQLTDTALDALIDALTLATLSGSLQQRSPLMALLAADLEVDVRATWRPDAAWFAGYRKLSLAKLIGEFFGDKAEAQALKRKKSELVEEVTRLFKYAAVGKLDDEDLAARVNAWTPVCLVPDETVEAVECVA